MRRRWAQLAVAARIARRDAARSRGRTALVASMVGLPVLVASVLAVLLVSAVPTEATMLRVALGDEIEARVELSCAGVAEQDEYGNGSCTVHGAMLRTDQVQPDLVEVLPAGTTLVPEARGEVEAEGAVGRRHHLTYTEVDVSVAAVADVFRLHEGRLPRTEDEVALARRVSDGLVPAVGERLTLRVDDASREVTVVGVLAHADEGPDVLALPGAGPVAVEPDPMLGTPPRWYVDSPAPVDWATVRDLNRLGVMVLSRAVVLDPPDPAEMPAHLTGGWLTADSRTAALAAAAVGAGLLEAVLLIGPAFAVGARRSVRDLALLATVGAERRDLRRVVLLGAVVIGGGASLVGATVGAGLGLAVAWVLGERLGTFPNLVVPWPYLAGFVVLGVVVATTAAWLPARRASRVDVVAALGGRRAEQHPHPAVPVSGAAAVVLGGAIAVVGAAARSTAFALVGTAMCVLGLVAASGALVALVARLAPHLGVAARLALRDAARQRGRTAPAVAAVLAAVAGATAGAVYLAADDARRAEAWTQATAMGSVQVALTGAEQDAPAELEDRLAAVTAALEGRLPGDVAPVVSYLPPSGDVHLSAFVARAPAQACPLGESDADLAEAEVARLLDDPRCAADVGWSSTAVWPAGGGMAPLVDDGTFVALAGLPGAEEAAAAVRGGAALVNDPRAVWPDGTARVTVSSFDLSGWGESYEEVVDLELPAHVVDWPDVLWDVVLPVDVVDELAPLGGRVGPVGLLARPLGAAPDEVELREALRAVDPDLSVAVQGPYRGELAVTLLLVVAATAVVGLGATWIVVGLAAAESRADLATLAAVGASPRTRRRVAGAQAGVVTVTGTALGLVAGLLLAALLVHMRATTGYEDGFGPWELVVPWGAVGVIGLGLPAAGVLVAMAATPSRLPLVRRIAT